MFNTRMWKCFHLATDAQGPRVIFAHFGILMLNTKVLTNTDLDLVARDNNGKSVPGVVGKAEWECFY